MARKTQGPLHAGSQQDTAAASNCKGLSASSSWQRVPIDFCYITGFHAPVCIPSLTVRSSFLLPLCKLRSIGERVRCKDSIWVWCGTHHQTCPCTLLQRVLRTGHDKAVKRCTSRISAEDLIAKACAVCVPLCTCAHDSQQERAAPASPLSAAPTGRIRCEELTVQLFRLAYCAGPEWCPCNTLPAG